MDVFVVHKPDSMLYAIYVKLSEDREKRTSLFLTYGGQTYETVTGTEAPSYVVIPEDIFERIVKLGREEFPPETSDVRDALEDSKKVRDRLLGLVEKVIVDKYLAMS